MWSVRGKNRNWKRIENVTKLCTVCVTYHNVISWQDKVHLLFTLSELWIPCNLRLFGQSFLLFPELHYSFTSYRSLLTGYYRFRCTFKQFLMESCEVVYSYRELPSVVNHLYCGYNLFCVSFDPYTYFGCL